MLKIAWHNITRRRNNSMLTICSIAIAVGIFTLIWSVSSLSRSGIELSRSRLGADVLVYPSKAQVDEEKLLYSGVAEMVYMDEKAFSDAITNELGKKIEETSGQFFLKTLPEVGCCEATKSLRIVGVDMESDFILKSWIGQEGIQSSDKQGIIVGCEIGKKAGDTTMLLNKSFKVSGVLHKTGIGMDHTIFMDIDLARKLATRSFPQSYFGAGSMDSVITCYLLKLKEGTDIAAFTAELQNKSGNINVVSVAETQSNLRTQITLFSKILFLFWAASLILCSIALISQFRSLVSARKKEIGYLRSIGMQRKEIYAMFLWEIGLLSAIGGLVGSIGGVILVQPLLNQLQELFTLPAGEWTISTALVFVFGGLGLALLLGALTSAVPVHNLSKLPPYEAISEGEL